MVHLSGGQGDKLKGKLTGRLGERPAVKNDATDPAPPAQLRLVIKCIDTPHILSTPIAAHPLVAGRADEQHRPDIDLSAVCPSERAISRSHAAFTIHDNELHIEDLHSTNGTRINGFQLLAGRVYRLRSGDEIELGALRFTVSLVRAPHPLPPKR